MTLHRERWYTRRARLPVIVLLHKLLGWSVTTLPRTTPNPNVDNTIVPQPPATVVQEGNNTSTVTPMAKDNAADGVFKRTVRERSAFFNLPPYTVSTTQGTDCSLIHSTAVATTNERALVRIS